MTILLIGKTALAKAAFGALLLANNVVEPPTMQQANDLLMKEQFDMVIYGVYRNADGSRVKRSTIGKTEVVYVAQRFGGCGEELK